MKRSLKTFFVLVSIFLLCANNAQGLRVVQSQEEQTNNQVDIVIDEGQEDLSTLFDSVDRFTQYGFAKVQKQVGVEIFEWEEGTFEHPIIRFGLINTKGEIVLDVIYNHISDFDENYYEIGLEQNGMYNSGLVSKKTGEVVIEPIYGWIPNIYEKNYFILSQYEMLDDQQRQYSTLFTQLNGVVQKALLPGEFQDKKFDWIWVDEISDNIAFVNAYSLIASENEEAGSTTNDYRWLVDEQFNAIDLNGLSNISQAFVHDDLLYISTYFYEQRESEWYSSASVFVGQVNEGVYEYETLIEDVPYAWYNDRENMIEYAESRFNWRTIKYDLVTKERIVSESYNNNYVFDLPRLDDLKFKMDCRNVDQEYHCLYAAYAIEDTEFTKNVLQDKNVTYVEYMSSDLYRVHLIGGKQNILKRIVLNDKAEYFFLFETDYEGWAHLEENILTLTNWQNDTSFSTIINIGNVTDPIGSNSDRFIVNNKENTWSHFQGQFFVINGYAIENNEGVNYTTVYKASTNEKILDNVKGANYYIDNDLVYGSYLIGNTRQGFIYKDELKNLNADWFNSFNSFGYAKYYLYTENESVEGLINRDGRLFVEANYLQTYFDYDGNGNHVVISYDSSSGMKYHHIDQLGTITSFGPYSNIVFNGKDPAQYQTDKNVYGFIYGNTEHSINESIINATYVTPFIDGVVLFSEKDEKEMLNHYVIDENDTSYPLEGVNQFIGRFVDNGTSIKYLKGVNNGVVEYIDVDSAILSSLNGLSFQSNSLYLSYKDIDGSGYYEVILIQKDDLASSTTFRKLDQINGKNVTNVNKVTRDDSQTDVPSVDGFYYVYVEDNKVGIINGTGDVIVQPIYSYINLRSEYFEGALLDEANNLIGYHLIHRDNTVIRDNDSLPLLYDYLSDVNNRYYVLQKGEVSHTYLKSSEGLTYVGELSVNKLDNSTSIYEYYVIDESKSGNRRVGLLDDKGNVIISHDKGYEYFRYDRKNQVIIPYGSITTEDDITISIGGMYDFSGNEILPKEYQVNFDYNTQEVIVDKNGFVNVSVVNDSIRSYNFTDDGIQSSGLTLTNQYHLATKTLKFDYNIFSIEKFNEYWKLTGLLETDRVFDPDTVVNNYSSIYVQERNDGLYYLDVGVALFDENYHEIIGLSKYDTFEMLDGSEELFKVGVYYADEYNSGYLYGVINKQGIELVAPEYTSFEFIKEWNMYILSTNTTSESKAMLVDSNFIPVVPKTYTTIYYNYDIDWMMLYSEYNLDDKDSFDYKVQEQLVGFYNLKTKTLVEPQFVYFNTESLKKLGQVTVNKVLSIENMVEYCDEYGFSSGSGDSMEPNCWVNVQFDTKMGIINLEGEYVLDPIYDYITDFNSQGFARFGEHEVVSYYDEYYDETFISTSQKNTGLYSIENGIVVDPIYSELHPTTQDRFYYDAPLFDKDNHIKSVVNESTDEYYISKVGMINKHGVVIEPNYQNVSYLDGKYYLQQLNGSWIVRDLINNVDINVDLSELGIFIKSIQLVEDYIIVETMEFNEFQSYSDYAVFTMNLEPYIDFGHSSIRYDGTYWYLEKYNQVFNTYQRAVLDNDLNTVVPFENKYDSLGEYIGGYAIGQSGQKQTTEDEDDESLFNIFFTKVSANQEDDFVLDIINEQGQVVGDLSDKYDSVTLLGMDGDDVKALVVVDGKYYIGTLVSNEVDDEDQEQEDEVILVQSISIIQTSVALKVGQTAQLDGVISPANYTESIKEYWSTDDESIAVVDGKGLVKAVGVGETKINYHVNDLVASTKVVTSANQASLQPLTPTQQDVYEQLTNAINNPDSLSREQWLDLLSNNLESNPDFVSYLNDEQAEQLEQTYLELFKDNLVYNLENTDEVLSTLVGFILGADLQSLLDNKTIEINVVVKNQVSDEDQQMIIDYLNSNNLDESKVFSFDVTVTQVIDGEEVPMVFSRPVLMRGALSEALIGVGTLNAITIHGSELYDIELHEIDVEVANASFVIRSDKFSAFSIFSTETKVVVGEPEQPNVEDVQSQTNTLWWLLAGVIVLVIIASTKFISGRKEEQE